MASAAALSAARRHCGTVALSETARSASGCAAASRRRAETARMLVTTCAATASLSSSDQAARVCSGSSRSSTTGTFSRKNRSRGFEARSVSNSCTSVAASIEAGSLLSTASICWICCAATATRVGGGGSPSAGGGGGAVEVVAPAMPSTHPRRRLSSCWMARAVSTARSSNGFNCPSTSVAISPKRPATGATTDAMSEGTSDSAPDSAPLKPLESKAGPRSAPRLPIRVPISGVLPSRSGRASAMACCSAAICPVIC